MALLSMSGWAATLDERLAALSAHPVLEAAYEETRQMALLDAPLSLRGRLVFRAPDYLAKSVETSPPELLVVEGSTVRRQLGAQEIARFALDAHPALRAFVEAYRATLSGDRPALEAHYRIEYSEPVDAPERDDWTLVLIPRDSDLAARVERIVLDGRAARLQRIRIHEPGGDLSDMRVMATAGDAR